MIKLSDILCEGCWEGYKQVGMKTKGGKQVPNCVPESVNEFQTQRQLRNPKKEMLVVKNNKVIVIDKKDWKKYQKQGYTVAENINEAHYTVVANLGGGRKRKENLDNDSELGKFMYDMEKKNAISIDVTKFSNGKKQTIIYDWDGGKWVIKKKGSIQRESVNENISPEAVVINMHTNNGQKVIQDFIDDYNIDAKKLADYVIRHKNKKEKYDIRDIIANTGIGKLDGVRKRYIKMFRESKLKEAFTKGTVYGGNLKIDGKKVPVEVVLQGADNKKNAFIVKVLHIDKKYYSKLPKDGILHIPARIFRAPGGGWYKVKVGKAFEDKVSGGLSDNMSLSDIAKKHNVSLDDINKEFLMGVKVEMEHTTDKEIAKEIAKDHIFEDPKYYTKLATIEN